MKIAVISDIHANKYALEKVLIEAKAEKVSKLFILGDIVGYYYHPKEVMQLLEEWDYEFIKGNHEIILEKLKKGEIPEQEIRRKYGSGTNRAIEDLDQKRIEQLTSASTQKKIISGNFSFLLCHGAPWDTNQYIYPDADKETLDRCNNNDIDYILIGHTHYPFICKCTHSIIINPGSVGQSRKKGGVADWVIINDQNGVIIPQKTEYDTTPLIVEIGHTDPDVKYLKSILKR